MNHLYLSFTCAFPWTCVPLVFFNEVFYFLQNSVTDNFICICQAHFARLWVLNSTAIRLKYSNIQRNILSHQYVFYFWTKIAKNNSSPLKIHKMYALRSCPSNAQVNCDDTLLNFHKFLLFNRLWAWIHAIKMWKIILVNIDGEIRLKMKPFFYGEVQKIRLRDRSPLLALLQPLRRRRAAGHLASRGVSLRVCLQAGPPPWPLRLGPILLKPQFFPLAPQPLDWGFLFILFVFSFFLLAK